MNSAVLDRLRTVVGDSHVIVEPDAMSGYLTDWTGRWTGTADAVVRPADTAQVAEVMRICSDARVHVCVQGGNTGLVGGSIPPADGAGPMIVLSTTRLNDIDDVDDVGRCIGVGAGVTVDAIDRAAQNNGLAFGVDLASRDSATAGGVVATNAGGIRMIRNGNTRHQVLGIEAVLADGRVLRRWAPLVKDNVGYDLPGLITGSEGTLAVITRVLFRLVVPATETTVVVAAVDEIGAAMALIGRMSQRALTIEAAEFMTEAGIELVHQHGARRPVAGTAPFYVLIEVSGAGDVQDTVLGVLQDADGIVDAVLEPGPARALWAAREGHTEAISKSTTSPVVKLDVSFPLRALATAVTELGGIADTLDVVCRPILFGHLGDGNVHVNLLDVPPDRVEQATVAVFGIVAAHGGSISAEHGIGRAKVGYTQLGRSEVDLAVMAGIKDTLDPLGLLNPGVLFG